MRKHLSRLKGGRLAVAAHPKPVATFVISDMPGDDVGAIASGPTVPDPTTQAEAVRILEKYRYPALARALPDLERLAAGRRRSRGDAAFARDTVHLIATARRRSRAAAQVPRAAGLSTSCSSATTSTTRRKRSAASTRGSRSARASRASARRSCRAAKRASCSATGTGGRGGRNTEYLAALALELDGAPGICALAADTDGIDGHGDHAGGIVVPETLQLGCSARLVAQGTTGAARYL